MPIRHQLVYSLAGLVLAVMIQGCAATTPQHYIEQRDHAGLANFYSQESQRLLEKAKHWQDVAEFYEKHPEEATGKLGPAEHAAHCRAIAEDYRKAAAEADALAIEHRRQRPHGMIN